MKSANRRTSPARRPRARVRRRRGQAASCRDRLPATATTRMFRRSPTSAARRREASEGCRASPCSTSTGSSGASSSLNRDFIGPAGWVQRERPGRPPPRRRRMRRSGRPTRAPALRPPHHHRKSASDLLDQRRGFRATRCRESSGLAATRRPATRHGLLVPYHSDPSTRQHSGQRGEIDRPRSRRPHRGPATVRRADSRRHPRPAGRGRQRSALRDP